MENLFKRLFAKNKGVIFQIKTPKIDSDGNLYFEHDIMTSCGERATVTSCGETIRFTKGE